MVQHLEILPNPSGMEIYFAEIRNRYKWLLSMGGERVLLYKRKYTGTRCTVCWDQIRKQAQISPTCETCFGTGFLGGYYKEIEIYISLAPMNPRNVTKYENGRRIDYKVKNWTLWEPKITNEDIIVTKDNKRLAIQEVSQTKWKSFILRQEFNLVEVERSSPIYSLPIS